MYVCAVKKIIVKPIVLTEQEKEDIISWCDEGIEICFEYRCDERVGTRFLKILEKIKGVK